MPGARRPVRLPRLLRRSQEHQARAGSGPPAGRLRQSWAPRGFLQARAARAIAAAAAGEARVCGTALFSGYI
eukprot:12356623-Alexandrium_andersonii.AAC.1